MRWLRTCFTLLLVLTKCCISGNEWCQLPAELGRHLDELEAKELPARTAKVVTCWRSVHEVFVAVCEGLYARRSVQQALRRVAVPPQRWRRDVLAWSALQRSLLHRWAVFFTSCATMTRMLVSGPFLRGLAGQFDTLAEDAVGSQLEARIQIGWFQRFQSMWHLAAHYSLYLQMLAFDAFDSVSDVAQSLHRIGHDGVETSVRLPPRFSIACDGNEAVQFRVNVTNISLGKRTRCRRVALFQHDELSAASVFKVVEARSAQKQSTRLVEVGVFQANLSGHVWDRVARGPGAIQLHLVDHWGRAREKIEWSSRAHEQTKTGECLGTGSDMAGQSNESTVRSVWQRFQSQGAECVEVPYWLPGDMARTFVDGTQAARNQVFFHRTTTVEASRSFADSSLDVVYIDGDHKWWSVLQDLAVWWPKVKPGGVLMGHDFHFNPLMEREGAPGGDANDVPMAIMGFFRDPIVIELHAGFVWSVRKPLDSSAGVSQTTFVLHDTLCTWLRKRMEPHWNFEVCQT